MELLLNGEVADLSDFEDNELAQAVLISLFSWRKSADDDGVAAPGRMGWWGDSYAQVEGDRIGSRLWLLQREKLTESALRKAEAYAEEALQWLIDDAIVGSVEVMAERGETERLDLSVTLYKPDDTQALSARFQDVWSDLT
ncbi:phage GP46 family protein [Sutterella sp.]|uniref:phage GP46 family protein n=1 Tax=Sutterella sp. TaxID=1981025 RepID=UPI0026E016D9|nr:phage GP46 family protein [Sutterella sp.]MDO5531430.1 phage GP46 family protein [Sutterella sp.]